MTNTHPLNNYSTNLAIVAIVDDTATWTIANDFIFWHDGDTRREALVDFARVFFPEVHADDDVDWEEVARFFDLKPGEE